MKTKVLLLLTFVFVVKMNAQETTVIIPNTNDSRVITTGVPFLLITSDARAASMGDMGVATSVDAFSQQWNPAKYAFSETKSGVGVSYTPYLSKLVNDIFLGNLTYFNRIDDRSAFAASLKYFSLGDIEFRENEFVNALIQRPNEFTLDASYALRLSPEFAMSVAMRYMRSDLKLSGLGGDATAASTFGVDISGYYQGEEEAYADFNGRWRMGFAIQNIGPKFSYEEGGVENFQPTNLRLGAGFDFIFDDYNKIAVTAEVAKLLVPTPPRLGTEIVFTDNNDNGTYEEADDDYEGDDLISETDNVIYKGQSNDVGFLAGMFQSFGDAPGGFSEEIKEFTYSLGAEYVYQDSFAFRAGYFNESEEKGARKFFAMGAGFKANVVNIDLSYLFSASKVQSPLENTLRFSLTFNIGAGEYREY
ncbi:MULTISPECIES: type IX secretion system outer membrane channel protein PorV [unclassified Algibacter]|uniref:type IX secretion system outer membrane channel protein PorV n=1 Tax=unclassified Algibacter TaxID=2615009 RepID=UPI00131E42E7|nr:MULTISPECIES: type IX secretion system outer membrane channel protein PorV [unclassified Algibacter]MCL5128953.1 type IX secretion system outer membrane channel protein PorV [Algibacter sp. L4_22]